jgi:putative solute:sodium symporter small subunit
MKKIEKATADQYFKEKNRNIVIYLLVWFLSSFGVVLFADSLTDLTINGYPFH